MGKHPVTHFEITAKDSKKLQDFYGGGIGQSRDGKGMLTVYIESDDLKADLAKVERAGGRTILPPQQAGPVTIALFQDPEGNVVGLANGM